MAAAPLLIMSFQNKYGKKDIDRDAKLQDYVFGKIATDGEIDIQEAAEATRYSSVYLTDLFSRQRILNQQINPMLFREGSIRG